MVWDSMARSLYPNFTHPPDRGWLHGKIVIWAKGLSVVEADTEGADSHS